MKLAIFGFGTVGRSVVKTLLEKKEIYKRKYGFNSKIIGIFEVGGAFINEEGLNVKELIDLPPDKFEKHKDWKPVTNIKDQMSKLDIDTIVELTYTDVKSGEPGLSHIKNALENKKHVVTSNKGPLAIAFPELIELAEKNKSHLRFEATVGAAIPIFHLAQTGLMGNKIKSVKGILNGTSNFILTQMTKQNVTFSIALKEARESGYAEADPSLDVGGIDAACKIVIIANCILNQRVTLADVKIKGIQEITKNAIELARDDGFVIRQIASAENGNLEVSPRLVPANSTFAIEGTQNLIRLETDLAKEIIIIGRGAGGMEAASAVISDILFINQNIK
ncbi:MAG: homoserine dehydrogenase [Candidatus Helarchaeota archaeon]